ncbi:hypothetical protein HanIR_Chr15g0730581 [Helianthus annuus]|nr:hypothetical protein HanIR_Chr15g0730581 [Helianthus annuus]
MVVSVMSSVIINTSSQIQPLQPHPISLCLSGASSCRQRTPTTIPQSPLLLFISNTPHHPHSASI